MVVGCCAVPDQLADKNTVSCVGYQLLCLITICMTQIHTVTTFLGHSSIFLIIKLLVSSFFLLTKQPFTKPPPHMQHRWSLIMKTGASTLSR